MESRKEKAARLFKEGYNCAQAVFCAYSDLYGIEEQTALRLSSSFGAGMGRMREVCGAVSGMLLLAGLQTGAVEGGDSQGKKKNYDMVQRLAREYKDRNGSILCRELLGLGSDAGLDASDTKPQERTGEYYKKRPCAALVEEAADIIDQLLLKEEPNGSKV